jgi:hypothetical protein
MRNKFQLRLILLTIIIILFPSICFSELKTVQGEYCQIYTGDMNNKEELEKFTDSLRMKSIENGLEKIKNRIVRPKNLEMTETSFRDIVENYIKAVVISHTKVGGRICKKVKITLDTDIINEYLKDLDREQKPKRELKKLQRKIISDRMSELYHSTDNYGEWCWDLRSWFIYHFPVKEKKDINVGILIETKIPNLGEQDRDYSENKEEGQFNEIIELRNIMNSELENRKFRIIDRRHLSKILEEQKLSSSGITDSDTVKLGKILNLDIIVLRLIYDNSKITKVLKVDTGEVLLFHCESNGWNNQGMG